MQKREEEITTGPGPEHCKGYGDPTEWIVKFSTSAVAAIVNSVGTVRPENSYVSSARSHRDYRRKGG